MGDLAADAQAELLIAVGEGAEPVVLRARERGVRAILEPDVASALKNIDSYLADGDAVLLKGSNGSGAWKIADYLKETRSL